MRREIGRSFFFDYEPAKRRRLLNYDGPLRAGPRLIAANVVVDLGREDRVWLQGPNGAGKTTLLAALRTTSTLPQPVILSYGDDVVGQRHTFRLDIGVVRFEVNAA